MALELYTVDAETYYDNDYSLRKMTPVEYILDPRFEMIMLAVKRLNKPSFVLEGHEVQGFLNSLDPNTTGFISHNALFDMCLIAWRYGFIPRLMVDTLGISRACLGQKLTSHSLEAVAYHLGLGAKGKEVHNVKGMNAAAIKAAGRWDAYKTYNHGDAHLCEGIFNKLVTTGVFPASEIAVMDMVLRCAVEPRFVLDQQVLAEHLYAIQQKKEELLAKAMLVGANNKSELMSNDKFAELLRAQGVEPPMKNSPVTGRQAYAFAKSDEAFLALQEHENPAVQIYVSARLGHKSTLEETRTQRFIDISNLQWPAVWQQRQAALGQPTSRLMPIPLRYGGAHTHRLSGDWKLNMQNLPSRGDAEKKRLKSALMAPPGYKVVSRDASQIEARIVAMICGQMDLVEAFAQGRDVYSEFASSVFGFPVTKTNVAERFVGKTSILQLGFGAGWTKFQWSIAIGSREQTGTKIELPDKEALRIVTGYRQKYSMISGAWRRLQSAIPILAGAYGTFDFGPCRFEKGRISLPSGLFLNYGELTEKNGEWTYKFGRETKRLYGGALLENIVQALARIIIMDAACRVQVRLAPYGIRLALQVHDELVYIVPDELVDYVESVLAEEMSRPPEFMPGLPLKSEGGPGQNYAECK